MKYRVTNLKTNEHFDVEHWCIFEVRDGINHGRKQRGWNEEKDLLITRVD